MHQLWIILKIWNKRLSFKRSFSAESLFMSGNSNTSRYIPEDTNSWKFRGNIKTEPVYLANLNANCIIHCRLDVKSFEKAILTYVFQWRAFKICKLLLGTISTEISVFAPSERLWNYNSCTRLTGPFRAFESIHNICSMIHCDLSSHSNFAIRHYHLLVNHLIF